MAITSLNKETFTEITVASDGILQVRDGYAEIAASQTPDDGDWIFVPNGGSMPVSEGTVYGRGNGIAVVL